ncbi:MAG: hypothetical protein HY711_01180 [Candidatus Melainabacteria bacterium]|nr:hypothetical protein [Candidatus Melainabacteria bacterium]
MESTKSPNVARQVAGFRQLGCPPTMVAQRLGPDRTGDRVKSIQAVMPQNTTKGQAVLVRQAQRAQFQDVLLELIQGGKKTKSSQETLRDRRCLIC